MEGLRPLIAAFCQPGSVVLAPFHGSGSTLVAACDAGCAYLGIEIDAIHHPTAFARLHGAMIRCQSAWPQVRRDSEIPEEIAARIDAHMKTLAL